MADYNLSYTGAQINQKLGQIKTDAELTTFINTTMGTTAPETITVTYYGVNFGFWKYGKLGFIYINSNSTAAITAWGAGFGAIPAGYVPLFHVFIPSTSGAPYIYLTNTGVIQSSGAAAAGTYFQGSAAYIIA